MACNQLQDRLHGYLDGELDAAGAAEFERHLQSCEPCRTALRAEHTLREALAKAQLYESAPAGLRWAVQSGMVSSAGARTVRYWKWLAIAATMLFAVSTVLLAVTWLRARSMPAAYAAAAVDAHLRSLQLGHLADVQSTDQHTVKPWFDGRVDFAPRVADFSEAGFRLLGGRLDVLNGKTVAALVYGRRKHIINVFVALEESSHRAGGAGELQGYHWLAWQFRGFDYVAVSDAADTDLAELRLLFEKD